MSSNASGSPNLVVFLQDACLKHQYVRSRDVSTIVERPERVRAVKTGLAVALSRLEGLSFTSQSLLSMEASNVDPSNPDDLAKALDQMTLGTSTTPSSEPKNSPVQIVHSTASVDILNNAAVKFIHGDIGGDVYLEKLKDWVANSVDKISKGESEIPTNLSQGDLYCGSSFKSNFPSASLTIVFSMSRFTGCYSRSVGDGLRSRRYCCFERWPPFPISSSHPQAGFLCCTSPRPPLWGRYTLWILFRQQRSRCLRPR